MVMYATIVETIVLPLTWIGTHAPSSTKTLSAPTYSTRTASVAVGYITKDVEVSLIFVTTAGVLDQVQNSAGARGNKPDKQAMPNAQQYELWPGYPNKAVTNFVICKINTMYQFCHKQQ